MPSIYLMRYGVSLYVIPIEYRCSIVLFVVLLGLSRTRWRVRLCLEVLLFLYCQWYDRWDVASFIGGLFLAELDRQRHASSPVPQMNVNRFRAACHSSFYGISLIAAFFLLSTPELQAGHTPGFMLLSHLDPTHRRLHSLGALLLVFALARMPSAHFLFNLGLTRHLGNISYALYLVHELVLHIWGWPAVPTMWRLTGQKTAIQYQLRFYLAFLGHHVAGTLGC
jgi:peptidoglycan/LPS O-acetylase OafA/YrhL